MGYALGAISRLENVISNISRLAESLSIRIEITTASDILLQTLRLVRRNWESREQSDRIQTRIAPDLPQILCDRIAISVALQLLLDNALKFSTDAVILDIRLSPHGLVEFRVIDQGIGIAPALRDRIFEPFFQADQQDSRKYGGAGVGLAIVRLILERHHTAIHIESHVGEGSTFMFSLPRVPPDTLPD
jgi:signal transduction histidine kinase